MKQEKINWTEQQDAAITMLYEQRHIQDWNEISRILNEQLNYSKKTPKQCKQRYTNQLSNTVFKIEWSVQEEKLFIKLHNEIGNKWATIAQHLVGKTDNCVKNHFYSKLRKLLRKLNKIIQFYLKRQFRPIDISIMYKIVEAAQQRFKQKPSCQENTSLQCLNVENQMLEFAMFKSTGEIQQEQQLKYTPEKIQQYKELIKEIYRVSKLYKRKSKKAPINYSKKNKRKQVIKMQEQEDDLEEEYKNTQKIPTTILIKKVKSESYSEQEVKKQYNENEYQQDQPFKQIVEKVNQPNQRKNGHSHNHNSRIQVQQGQGIQALLRTAGILHDEIKVNPQINKHARKYSNSQYNVNTNNPMISSPNLSAQQPPMNFMAANSSAQYSPLHSYSSQQVQNFLGFSMMNTVNNGYTNFTLSEKSSFKSYSEIDPSQIQNPFFDNDSSYNSRLMFPMNFNIPATHQYQQTYNPGGPYANYGYQNIYFSQSLSQQSPTSQQPQRQKQYQNNSRKK